jgi:hypothetical protein
MIQLKQSIATPHNNRLSLTSIDRHADRIRRANTRAHEVQNLPAETSDEQIFAA